MLRPIPYLLLIPCSLFAQSGSVLNMSHDLVSKGIATTNMQPNTPALDARPLFEQAVAYAVKNGIGTLTADTGSYYFLTLHNGTTAHAYLNAAANLTIDWQHSDLYFASSNYAAITCANCSSVTMQNFTVDYQQLPFTQVTITAVDSANGILTYQTIAGYQSPASFNTNRASDGADAIWIFIFRNGAPLAAVGRLGGARQATASTITIADTNSPWASPSALATIQPGDIAVYTDRSGPPALNFVQGQNITVRDVSVYASGQIGLYFGRTLTPTADHVQVIPRPGTTRLISTNADGIHTSFANGVNTFSDNIVRRTCDDALAIAAEWLATVSQTPSTTSPTTVAVSRSIVGVPFPEGTSVAFVNPADGTVAGTATIQQESPASASQTLAANESVTLTLSAAVPALAAGYEMINADPAKHGSGSVIRNNTVQQGVFSRGIWLSGVQGVTAHDNFITQTSKIGIFVEQLTAPPNGGNLLDTGPSSNITIQNNVVDNSMNYGGLSEGPIVEGASIETLTLSTKNGQVSTAPNANIAIQNNLISNTPRSAIRVENTAAGQVNGNVVEGYGTAANNEVYYAPFCCETVAQYEADFKQAVVVLNSTGFGAPSNTTAATAGGLISSVSAASYFPKAAPESLVTAFWTNPSASTTVASSSTWPTTLGGYMVTVTDSAGVSRQAQIYYVTASQLSFEVPTGTAAGIATVTIGSYTGGLQVDTVAPSLYSQNSTGQGVAAAGWALYPANGAVTTGFAANYPCAPGSCVAVPISLGGTNDSLYVTLYGTGLRGFSGLANASATVGGIPAQVQFIGTQGQYPALDQVNILVPHSLVGEGEVPVLLTVDGQTANAVTISLK